MNKTRTEDLRWAKVGEARRGPKPALSLEKIVAAAIEIADDGGLEAVSMERVAQTFGYTTMSLYRYVPGKAELIELMIDAAIGVPPVSLSAQTPWRSAVEAWALALWAGLHERPWLLGATGSLRLMGPNELRWLEAGLSALVGTGLSVRERQACCLTVLAHVRGMAQFSVKRGASGGGLTTAAWERATRPLLSGRQADFPQVAELLSAENRQSGHDPLRFGLQCVLAGIEQLANRATVAEQLK